MPNPFEAQVREMLARGMKDEEIVAALTGKSQTTTASAEQSRHLDSSLWPACAVVRLAQVLLAQT